jgi:hypothetical protein
MMWDTKFFHKKIVENLNLIFGFLEKYFINGFFLIFLKVSIIFMVGPKKKTK